jgi:hypothetical protein
MVRLGVLLAGLLAIAVHVRAEPVTLPALTLQDQESRHLELGDLRGRVVIIVYGTRARVDDHTTWGRRLDLSLIAHGAYRATDALEQRPVRILALAQMGGIPSSFRPIIRTVVRQHTPADFSLWLDWDDRMSVLFGADPARSSVVVADRAGRVRLVTTESSSDAAVARVVEVVLGLQ